MKNNKIPDWLVEVQNKSWEPEILISGITLTFVFLLSNDVYNFYGMLVQDFGVFEAIAKMLYRISVLAITGLKIILILHLILRGLWTGVVGLSYVFPNGVNKENLSISKKNTIYDKPDILVIRLEKICSVMFSFIFSSIWAGIAVFLYFIPLIVLFIAGLDIYYISIISISYTLATSVILVAIFIFHKTKFVNAAILQKLENSIFENILNTYLTNIGKVKTFLIFLIYFLIIIFMSRSAILKFGFYNDEGIKKAPVTDIIRLDNGHYEDSRDQELRIPKATIDQYRVKDNKIKLYISLYKEDDYTIKEINNDKTLLKESGIKVDSTKNVSIADLYSIMIDDKRVAGLKWYSTKNNYTNQKVITAIVTLDSVKKGYHELKIDKLYLKPPRKKIKPVKNWDIIPFEIISKENI